MERRRAAALLATALLLWAVLPRAGAAQEAAPAPKRPWNELDLPGVSLRLDFQALEDGAFFSQDAANEQQVGDLPSKALFRVDDLLLTGQIRFSRPWTFAVGGNYRGLDPTSARGWTTTYVYLSIPLGTLGSVTLGKQKEGAGLEMTEDGRDIPFMERSTMSTAFAFIDSHVVGVRFAGTAVAERLTWSAGWFNNWLDDGLSFSQSGQIYAGRVTGLPLEAEGGRRLVHAGLSASYRQAPGGSFKMKSVPEVYEAPDFVDTGSFAARHGTTLGGEVAAVDGPVTVSAEYAGTFVSSPQTGNTRFRGYYAEAAWLLTGETRPYDHRAGVFRAISPASPFSFRHGGSGAWELAARYSFIDLTSGAIEGGRFDRWSGALSWYPTRQWRFEFNYGYGRLQRSGLSGVTRFYQLRLQFVL